MENPRVAGIANAFAAELYGARVEEREIEGLCVKLLLTQQPVATDLHRVSAALKIAGDLERIGDQATDIAEIALTLQGELDGELSAHLREMGDRACSILHDATEAFVERDAERARATIGEDAADRRAFRKCEIRCGAGHSGRGQRRIEPRRGAHARKIS